MEKALCKIASAKVVDFNSQGFILAAVLLFLSILSLFVVGSLKANLLFAKSKDFYLEKIRSFYLAELKLVNLEDEFLSSADVIEKNRIEVVGHNYCGDLYKVRAKAKYRNSVSILESTVLKSNAAYNCPVGAFRQSFLIIK